MNGAEEGKFGRQNRIELLDFLRGVSLIYVMLYHLGYDLIAVKGMNITFWGAEWFQNIHQFFIGLLIVVSGICCSFSRDAVRRGAVLFFMGSVFTIATDIFMHDRVIVFGVLSFFGVMMMLCGLAKPIIDNINPKILFFVSLLLFIVTIDFVDKDGLLHLFFTDIQLPLPENTQYSYTIGIMPREFYSSDFFPLIPYGFLYIMGAALSRPIAEKKLPRFFYAHIKARAVNFIGRYSLWFYLIHQPIFFGILFLF